MINGRNLTIDALVTRPAFNGSKVTYFEYEVEEKSSEIPQRLICRQGDSNELMFEKTIGIVVGTTNLTIVESGVWIHGHSVSLVFSIRQVFPELQHGCSVISGRNKWNLTRFQKTRRIWKNAENMTLLNISSEYKFNASMEMLGGQVKCTTEWGSIENKHSETVTITRNIYLSAPCVTEVDLGSSRHWLEGEIREIRVTSRNCSIWSVRHTCFLVSSRELVKTHLKNAIQRNFTSIHQLRVVRWMGQSDWSVRCSVNQSGVVYDDIVTRSNQQPEIFYPARLSLHVPSLFINVSHAQVRVISSQSRPPINNIKCQLHDSSEKRQNITADFSLNSRSWVYNGPVHVSTPVGTDANAIVIVNCIAQQIVNNIVVYEPHCSAASLLKSRHLAANQQGQALVSDWRKVWLSVTSASLAVLSLAMVIQCVITRRRSQTRLTTRQQMQCTRGAIQMRPVNQVPPNVNHLAAPEDSCPYDYPTAHGAESGGGTYDKPDEQQVMASQGLHVEDRLQPLYINYMRK